MQNQQTDTAASSAAPQQTFEIPSDPQANLEWRKTGELPAAAAKGAKPKEASTPSEENASAAPSKDGSAETAPASATGSQQEKAKPERRSAAAIRLDELLADLKAAGYKPEELKTLKREAAAPAKAAPETTANPQGLEPPVKPKDSDLNEDGSKKYDTWEKLEAARDEYFDKLADFRARQAVAEDRRLRAEEASQQTLNAKVADAEARYGAETKATIGEAVRGIISDAGVAPVVKAMLNESPVLVDMMFVLGSKPDELAAFIDLAKTNPGAAIRKVALLEQFVEQELAKGTAAAKGSEAAADGAETTERAQNGQFQKQTPANKKPAAPPPAEELNTRGSAPPDPKEAAIRNNDFRAFKEIEDREDLAKRRGA